MALPKKVPALIKKITRIDNKIISIIMNPLKKAPNFKAGQFLHFSLDEYDYTKEWPESRVFSIASAPENRNEEISIIVSKQGRYTQRIFDECEVGKQVWLKFPYGEFTLNLEEKTVLIAGGTGISPFLSIIDSLRFTEKKNDIVLYYGVQKESHLIGLDTITQYSSYNPDFKENIFIEFEKTKEFRYGNLDLDLIYSELADEKQNFYISGPKNMIDTFTGMLLEKGVNKRNIFIDEWE